MKKVLVIDVGGTNVKFLATGHKTPRRFASGPKMTPRQMVAGVKQLASDWKYDAVTIGYPGVIKKGRIVKEPQNLGPGWVGFNFKAAFGRPVKLINDAAMQALGSYNGGLLLFLGLGTGLGSALIADGAIVPLELAHLSYKHATYEDYVGLRGLERLGMKKWRKHVANVAERFMAALNPDDVVFGGGGAKHLRKLPKGCRLGDNSHAFLGGLRLWNKKEE
jgi:predicted NBD/HSP70 family sugar kinase